MGTNKFLTPLLLTNTEGYIIIIDEKAFSEVRRYAKRLLFLLSSGGRRVLVDVYALQLIERPSLLRLLTCIYSRFCVGIGIAVLKGDHKMRRYGQLIQVKPDRIEDYERIHEEVWPEVLATIHACNMRNYSIFRLGTLLVAYFEYVGNDFAADMQKMAADPKTQEWWTHTDPMQEPWPERAPGAWWAEMKEVFHTD